MGARHSYQCRHQRWAWNANAAAAATKNPACKHRSLSTPLLLGDCATRHCQGPVIHGQIPQENTQRTTGCCNVMLASAATGLPSIPPSHSLSEPEPLNQPLLSPPPVWVKNRRQRGTYMQRRGQNQSWTLGVMLAKKRKGNLSMKPQEQQIKSPQSTWCTLHLWNTWINNKSFQNWGSRLWEQL